MRELSVDEAMRVGIELAMNGAHREAAANFRGVLLHEPENAKALNHLGASLFELGPDKLHEALYCFWRAIKLDWRYAAALGNYGSCLAQLGHWEEAVEWHNRAIHRWEKTPNASRASKAMAYNNLGNTLERLGRHAEALVALDKGIAYDPTDPFPHYNRGIALVRLNRHREGIAALEHSLTLRSERPTPEDSVSRLNLADTHYNLAVAKLLLGELGEGFKHYEARLLTSENQTPNFGLSQDYKWQPGESIEGKTVLLHGEQGLGDTIQSLRFLPQVFERGAKEVLFITHAAMRSIVRMPGVRVMQPGEKIAVRKVEWKGAEPPAAWFDCWAATMSLPYLLGVRTEADIPPPWQPTTDRIDCRTGEPGLHVGVCWSGNWRHKNDAHRSIPLETFAEIFEAPCHFVSLQQEVRQMDEEPFRTARERGLREVKLETFEHTAALIRNLDLVVTVDTAVAHLAGSIGVPTFVLVPRYSTDWRWQLERTDSPWYPSMTLFRQNKIGEWRPTLLRVFKRLTETAAQRAAA